MTSVRSFMYNRNRTGTKTEPCCTPCDTFIKSEKAPFYKRTLLMSIDVAIKPAVRGITNSLSF